MKKLFLAASLLLGALAITSCNNGAYDANPDADASNTANPLNVPGGEYYMTCKVDGAQYTGNGYYIGTINGTLFTATSNGSVTGDNGDYNIGITISDYAGMKAYSESGNSVGLVMTEKSQSNNPYTGVLNTVQDVRVTITEVNGFYINGTFQGTVTNMNNVSKKITDGSFHVKKI